MLALVVAGIQGRRDMVRLWRDMVRLVFMLVGWREKWQGYRCKVVKLVCWRELGSAIGGSRVAVCRRHGVSCWRAWVEGGLWIGGGNASCKWEDSPSWGDGLCKRNQTKKMQIKFNGFLHLHACHACMKNTFLKGTFLVLFSFIFLFIIFFSYI